MRFCEGPGVDPTQYLRLYVSWNRIASEPSEAFYGGGRRIRTSEVVRRQIYSLFPLATRESLQGMISQLLLLELAMGLEPATC